MNYISTHTYDDQTVRWLLPDPAMQFSNPYLGIGNNPVVYVDPDGEFIQAMVFGGLVGGLQAQYEGGNFFEGFLKGAALGGVSSLATFGIDQAFSGLGKSIGADIGFSAANGLVSGGIEKLDGGKFSDGFASGTLKTYAKGGMRSNISKSKREFEEPVRERGIQYWRGNLDSRDNYFGNGFFETGWATGDFIFDNFSPDWSWYRDSQNGLSLYDFLRENLDITFQGELTIGAQAGGHYKFAGLGPGLELNVGNLQLAELSSGSSQQIRGDWVGNGGVYHVSQRIETPVASVYQSFDTRGTGYFNHDFGGSVGPIGYSNQTGGNLSFDVGASFLVGARRGITIGIK
jgi:hypothetical protein